VRSRNEDVNRTVDITAKASVVALEETIDSDVVNCIARNNRQ